LQVHTEEALDTVRFCLQEAGDSTETAPSLKRSLQIGQGSIEVEKGGGVGLIKKLVVTHVVPSQLERYGKGTTRAVTEVAQVKFF